MKNAYIMLANDISGMGGGQKYISNKLKFMTDKGWSAIVFSSKAGDIVIQDLKKYEKYITKVLVSAPLIYPDRVVNKTIDEIVNRIGQFDEAIIESCSGQMALWGEILAERLNCKHMVHLLDERNDLVVPEGYLDFFRFKLNRKELSGINSMSLKMLFRNSEEIDENNSYYLPSFCVNVVEDIAIPKSICLYDNSIKLCCIGRLEKNYVSIVAKSFAELIRQYPNKKFSVLFIGDSSEKSYKKNISALFDGIDNVNLIMPGFIYPIPKALFGLVDVFVSSSGSATLSYRNNRPTISIDGNDGKAIGVLGYTTFNALYRDCEEQVEPVFLLKEILFNNYLQNKEFTPKKEHVGINVLEKHIEFFDASNQEKLYYNVFDMECSGKDVRKKKLRMILGSKGYYIFHDPGMKFLKRVKKCLGLKDS